MDPRHSNANTPRSTPPKADNQGTGKAERFIQATFEKLPARTKVLIALFSALNSAATLTQGFDLSDHLWKAMQSDACGPLVGESEETNWLKGVCDGIRMMSQYS
jgi:hypothetical protein